MSPEKAISLLNTGEPAGKARLIALVLDSVTSAHSRRSYRTGLEGFFAWSSGGASYLAPGHALRRETELGRLAPHDLRRTCAKLCRRAGEDLEHIQLLLGHASVQTTERYLGTEQNLLSAVNDGWDWTWGEAIDLAPSPDKGADRSSESARIVSVHPGTFYQVLTPPRSKRLSVSSTRTYIMNDTTLPPPQRDWQRIDGIDLLRGLSIIFVLLNHVNMRLLSVKLPYTRGLPDQLVYSLVWNGQSGVQLFFVVSGFLITSTSIRRWGTPGKLSPGAFYKLRFARIAPLMLALLAILSGLHFLGVPGYVIQPKTGGLGRALLAALTFHLNYLEASRDYLPVNWDILWSLSVEEMLSLFPFGRPSTPEEALSHSSAALLHRRWTVRSNQTVQHESRLARVFLPGGMDAIAIGSLTAILTAGRTLRRSTILTFGCIGSALLVFSLCFSITAYKWNLGKTGVNMTILAAGAALVITAASQSRWQAPRLLTPLRILDQRSYEIYLTHMFAVMGLFALFVHLGKPMRGVPVLFATAIVAAGALGWVVAVLFAEPMNLWLRRPTGLGESVLGSAQPQVD